MICTRADQTTHLRRERGQAQTREARWFVSLRVMLEVLISFSFRAGPGIKNPVPKHRTTGIRRELLTSLAFHTGPGVTNPVPKHGTVRYTTGSTTTAEHFVSAGLRSFVRILVINVGMVRRELLRSFAFRYTTGGATGTEHGHGSQALR